jgi:hypothetical protein
MQAASMTTRSPHSACFLLLAASLSVAGTPPAARAQLHGEQQKLLADEDRRLLREALAQQALRLTLQDRRSRLEKRIIVVCGTGDRIRDHLETLLSHRLDDLRLACDLTPDQSKKLNVAGRGDIKRLLDRLDPALKHPTSQTTEDIQELVEEVDGLERAVDGPFGAGSLFSKTLGTTLSRDQFAGLERALGERNAAWYVIAVSDTVRKLAWVADLSDTQSKQLVRLLLTETRAPRKIGKSDYAFVMFQASKLPEIKLTQIFHGAQWEALKKQFASWASFETPLKKEGFVFDDAPGVAGADRLERTNKSEDSRRRQLGQPLPKGSVP